MEEKEKYDIAISFARADRNIALGIYLALKIKMPKREIYYYPEKQEKMLGKKLKGELQEIYRHQSKYVILIVSEDYIKRNNVFVQTEINAFMPRYEMNKSVYLIPIIVDETKIDKVHKKLNGITTFPWKHNPEELATIIDKIINTASSEKKRGDSIQENKDKININNSSLEKSPIITGGGEININYG